MHKRTIAAICGLLLAVGLSLVNPGSASAQQSGLQQITVQNASWSSVYVQFACGNSYTVPIGATWGEGRANPACGSYTYQSEPANMYVGPGWCLTFWWVDQGGSYSVNHPNYAWGGSTGGWFQVWHNGPYIDWYTTHVESWYGGWCPTSGGASFQENSSYGAPVSI